MSRHFSPTLNRTAPCAATFRVCRFASETSNPHFDTLEQEDRWNRATAPSYEFSKKAKGPLDPRVPTEYDDVDIEPRQFRWTKVEREGYDEPQDVWTLQIKDLEGNLLELSRFYDEDSWTVYQVSRDYGEGGDEYAIYNEPGDRPANRVTLKDSHPALHDIEKQLGQTPKEVKTPDTNAVSLGDLSDNEVFYDYYEQAKRDDFAYHMDLERKAEAKQQAAKEEKRKMSSKASWEENKRKQEAADRAVNFKSAAAPPVDTVDLNQSRYVSDRRFACETHSEPGKCTPECATLAAGMDYGHETSYDPTGTSYGPADYAMEEVVYVYDKEVKGVARVTWKEVDESNDREVALLNKARATQSSSSSFG